MFGNLMRKEFRLALQAPAIVFEFFGFMVFIPAYPYLIIFFYGLLGVFFVCMFGRENHDVEYTALLPVSRPRIVEARICLCAILELVQIAGTAICSLFRAGLGFGENPVGLDANAALIGCGLLLVGVFNVIFFPMYYKNPQKIGIPFLIASLAYAAGMVFIETLAHFPFPFFEALRQTAPQTAGPRLLVLGIGAACFAALTFLATRISVRRFQKVNIAA